MFKFIWEPRDVIACLVIITGAALLACGIDGVVGGIVIAVVAYYFGWQSPTPRSPAT